MSVFKPINKLPQGEKQQAPGVFQERSKSASPMADELARLKTHSYELKSVRPTGEPGKKKLWYPQPFGNNFLADPPKHPLIQPKLSVNTPGDRYEQEADAMADRVMGMGHALPSPVLNRVPFIQRKCAACEEEEEAPVQRKESNNTELRDNSALDSYVAS